VVPRALVAVLAILFAGSAMGGARAQTAAGRLTFAPHGASVGAPVVATGSGLTPNARYALVWHTGAATWDVHDGKFLGIRAPDVTHVLATTTSDAAGRARLPFAVPEDFGYVHDAELRPDDAASTAARGGFTVIPKLTISPASGTLGTPITVTMTGVGYRFYQAVWHLMYDRAQTGWLSAITTHGTARVTIPASGAVGLHTLQAIEGPGQPYLNEQQSPNYMPLIPTLLVAHFRVQPGPVRLPASPLAQSLPRARTMLAADPPGPMLAADYASGVVGSTVALSGGGFAPKTQVAIGWETVVGNRISDTGWETQIRPLTTIASGADGTFALRIRTPDDLGGSHRIVARQNTPAAEAAVAYTLTPSVAVLTPARVASGGEITVHVKGVGWSETGNIYTLVVDNAYFGYACGFNSQGDVTVKIRAPGEPGWHFVELYPAIYNGKISGPGLAPGSGVNGSYFLLPMLNVADHPGEHLPAFHLAVFVQ
jgi:hypothetical protein